MDALALLCNLHADGPFTLQRLRRSGCDSLAFLLELAPGRLAAHLDGSERTAERFLREALLLAERLEEENPWEPERPDQGEADEPILQRAPAEELPLDEAFVEDVLGEDELEEEAEVDEVYGHDEEEEEDEYEYEEEDEELEEVYGEEEEAEDEEEEEEDEEEEPLDEAAEAGIGHVLDAWREADRDEPPEDPVDYVLPRPTPPSAANQALDELDLDGLDPGLRERLGQIGVLSLKGLMEASPLELSQSLPLPFTRVKHVQFLARRLWNQRSRPLEAPSSFDELVAIERLDASGPFASERRPRDPGKTW